MQPSFCKWIEHLSSSSHNHWVALFGSGDKFPTSAVVFCGFVSQIHSSLFSPFPRFFKNITPSCKSLSARLSEKSHSKRNLCVSSKQESATYLFPRCTDTGYPGSCSPRCSNGPEDRDTRVNVHVEAGPLSPAPQFLLHVSFPLLEIS